MITITTKHTCDICGALIIETTTTHVPGTLLPVPGRYNEWNVSGRIPTVLCDAHHENLLTILNASYTHMQLEHKERNNAVP